MSRIGHDAERASGLRAHLPHLVVERFDERGRRPPRADPAERARRGRTRLGRAVAQGVLQHIDRSRVAMEAEHLDRSQLDRRGRVPSGNRVTQLARGIWAEAHEQPDEIRILLDRARFTQIRQTRAPFAAARPGFRITIQLCDDNNRELQFFRQVEFRSEKLQP